MHGVSERLWRLFRLEVYSEYEEGCMGKLDSAVPHVDFATPVPAARVDHTQTRALQGTYRWTSHISGISGLHLCIA